MPTVARLGPYRFFFFSGDRREPPHVHVERDDRLAKFWLIPVRLQGSSGFGRQELRRLRSLVDKHRVEFLIAWKAHFGH